MKDCYEQEYLVTDRSRRRTLPASASGHYIQPYSMQNAAASPTHTVELTMTFSMMLQILPCRVGACKATSAAGAAGREQQTQ